MNMNEFKCQSILYSEVVKDAMSSSGAVGELVGAIDQGTSSTRFLVFTKAGRIAASAQMEHTQIYPPQFVGRHEHDPLEIWRNTLICIRKVHEVLKDSEFSIDLKTNPLKAIGITNQRETTIAWNAKNSMAYGNAIVWDDLRTTEIASKIARGDQDRLRQKTGLPLASYFSGTKVRWLIENVPALKADLSDAEKRSQVRFGTVDSWLVYRLTGGKSFITDVTNASRWLFLDLTSLQWDEGLIQEICGETGIEIPISALPTIKSSSEVYDVCCDDCGADALVGVPIAGILGDQQAAMFGQGAFFKGEAKNTYGTGQFLMMNTGSTPTPSTHGLLTTVGYRLGGGETVYALEGSVSHSGSTIQWLRDQLQIISSASESETYARKVESNDGLYFVPAFSGLFAPYWNSSARACVVGMTASHNKNHFCRAALEAAAYQTKDIFDAIHADSNVSLKELRVDGGGTANKLLMQFQADLINVPVVKPVVKETTALGAAFAAGLAVGVWKNKDEIRNLWAEEERFDPSMDSKIREKNILGWKKAIRKSMGWEGDHSI